MNTNKLMLLGVLSASVMAINAMAADEVFFTGATAFRSKMVDVLRDQLGFTMVYPAGTTDAARGANVRTWTKGSTTVYESYSGSGTGIAKLAAGAAGTVTFKTALGADKSHTADFAFSDVNQTSTDTPNAGLAGEQVGVVPFVFVRNGSAAGVDNVSHNILKEMLYNGVAAKKSFTGVPSDTGNVYLMGRDKGSGTRITVNYETDYIQNTCNLYGKPATTGTWDVYGSPSANEPGYSSGGNLVTGLLAAPSPAIAYLSVGDTVNPLGTTPETYSLKAGLTYIKFNGVDFSKENIKQGNYSFWNYESLYTGPLASTAATTFKASLIPAIDAVLAADPNFVSASEMSCVRAGGDGSVIIAY